MRPRGNELIRITHLDDEPLYLELTKQIILAYDQEMKIETATSPGEALKLVEEGRADCVLLDYSMPEMDGGEFTRRVREKSDVPVINVHAPHG